MSLLRSFRDALRGLAFAIRTQRNMKVHLFAASVVITGGIYFSLSVVEWCVVILAIGLVVGLETMNTSIEELVNFVSPEKREEAGRIKDVAAGAVLMASVAALAIGLMLLFSKLY